MPVHRDSWLFPRTKILPVLVLGLLKNVGFPLALYRWADMRVRQSAQFPPDLRVYAQALLTTSLLSQTLIPYIHPTFYSLHNIPPEVRSFCITVWFTLICIAGGHCQWEEQYYHASIAAFDFGTPRTTGLFLIEDGQMIVLRVGRDAVPQLILDLFNLPS